MDLTCNNYHRGVCLMVNLHVPPSPLYLPNGILLQGGAVPYPPVSYSVIDLCQYGSGDISFILWFIIQQHHYCVVRIVPAVECLSRRSTSFEDACRLPGSTRHCRLVLCFCPGSEPPTSPWSLGSFSCCRSSSKRLYVCLIDKGATTVYL